MSSIKQQYNRYKNGIIFTLIFHILAFIALNINQFKIKHEYNEVELLIDFPDKIRDQTVLKPSNEQENATSSKLTTNYASSQSVDQLNKDFDKEYQKELEKAQNLVNDVSSQLSKEIPTINDLRMPVETTEGMNSDSIIKKLYSGDSNIEYFLENRYHTKLPIPVYLSQTSGVVTVNIIVDNKGVVISAEPIINANLNEKLFSYAKTAALKTRFNPIPNGNNKQSGYIKYKFIAQ